VTQVSYHYPDATAEASAAGAVAGYAERWLLYASILVRRGLGPVGAGLALAALWMDRRAWRRWIHLLAFPLLAISVYASSPVKHDRFLLASLSSAASLAGLGLVGLAARAPALALAAGTLALAPLVPASSRYVIEHVRPGTRDTVLDYLQAHAESGDRVLAGVDDLGLDRRRVELVTLTGSAPRDRLLARHVDWLVLRESDAWLATEGGLAPLLTARPTSPWSGPPLAVYQVPAAERARYAPIPLDGATLASSRASDALEQLRDGSRRTSWKTQGPQRPGDWIEVALAEPARLARVELDVGTRYGRYARGLELLVSEDGRRFVEATCVDERPPMAEQLRAPRQPGQVLLLLEPRSVRALRLVQTGAAAQPWGIAELRLYALQPSAP